MKQITCLADYGSISNRVSVTCHHAFAIGAELEIRARSLNARKLTSVMQGDGDIISLADFRGDAQCEYVPTLKEVIDELHNLQASVDYGERRNTGTALFNLFYPSCLAYVEAKLETAHAAGKTEAASAFDNTIKSLWGIVSKTDQWAKSGMPGDKRKTVPQYSESVFNGDNARTWYSAILEIMSQDAEATAKLNGENKREKPELLDGLKPNKTKHDARESGGRGRPPSPNGRQNFTTNAERRLAAITIIELLRKHIATTIEDAVGYCKTHAGKPNAKMLIPPQTADVGDGGADYTIFEAEGQLKRWATVNGTTTSTLRALSAPEWEERKKSLV